MPTLEEISDAAAKQHEQCVRECIEMDYAFKVGKLDEWVNRKYQQLMGEAHGGQPVNDGGTNPGA